MKHFFISAFFLACCPILKAEESKTLYIGPEFYHVDRKRENGTHQDGYLYGIRGGFDRIKPYSIYWGVEGSWASGNLEGESGGGATLSSTLTEAEVEGRLGYTLQWCGGWMPSITPFGGIGYYYQTNHFHSPSPLPLHFRDTFSYGAIGFLSSIMICPEWTLGLNFQAQFMWEGKSRVSNDPDFPTTSILIEDRTQYRVDLPVTYICSCWNLSLVPFYQLREFGGHESFPFDFIETKLVEFGLRVLFGYTF